MRADMFGCDLQLPGDMMMDELSDIPGSICKCEIEADAGSAEDMLHPRYLPETAEE